MKAIKLVLTVVAALVVLLVGGVTTKFFLLSPASRPARDMKAPTTPEAIARGKYLAHNVLLCVGCHSEANEKLPGDPVVPGKEFQGRLFPMGPGFPGTVRAPNLTSDKETGLGNFTDGEIVRAMREGIGRDGRPLFNMMPYQAMGQNLGDDDTLAVVAYLRTLAPVHHDAGKTELKFPISMFIRAVPKPVDTPAPPMPTEPLARGKWLLKVANCGSCHNTHDDHHELIPGQEFAGGDGFPIGPKKVFAANITSHPAMGVGAYSDQDLERVFLEGKNKAGRSLYFMPFGLLGGMTEEDRKALILAIRQIPPVAHMVAPPEFP